MYACTRTQGSSHQEVTVKRVRERQATGEEQGLSSRVRHGRVTPCNFSARQVTGNPRKPRERDTQDGRVIFRLRSTATRGGITVPHSGGSTRQRRELWSPSRHSLGGRVRVPTRDVGQRSPLLQSGPARLQNDGAAKVTAIVQGPAQQGASGCPEPR